MRLSDYLAEDLVFVIDAPKNKQALLEALVVRVKSHLPSIDERKLLVLLEEREQEVSTGIGNGVAIPHAVVSELKSPICVIVKANQGVEFKAIDDAPVHVAFLLLSPPQSTGTHLRLLARVARLVMKKEFVQKIIAETDARKIYQFMVAEDDLHV